MFGVSSKANQARLFARGLSRFIFPRLSSPSGISTGVGGWAVFAIFILKMPTTPALCLKCKMTDKESSKFPETYIDNTITKGELSRPCMFGVSSKANQARLFARGLSRFIFPLSVPWQSLFCFTKSFSVSNEPSALTEQSQSSKSKGCGHCREG